MTESMNTGNSIRPLRNVVLMAQLIKRLEGRAIGLPGMGVFYGPSGFGKTFAAAYAAASMDAIHISVQELWTKKTLIEEVLAELGQDPARTIAQSMKKANQALAIARRPLIIDEADYAIKRNMIGVIRDLHDGSQVPVVMIGMERLPQKLRKWELVDNRILEWSAAEPADLKDAQMLAELYASNVQVGDDLIAHILNKHHGRVRRMVTDFAYVREQANIQGLTQMGLDEWGKAPFLRAEAPQPRRDWDAA